MGEYMKKALILASIFLISLSLHAMEEPTQEGSFKSMYTTRFAHKIAMMKKPIFPLIELDSFVSDYFAERESTKRLLILRFCERNLKKV